MKWIALDACTSLSESDSKNTLTLNFMEKSHNHFKNILIY